MAESAKGTYWVLALVISLEICFGHGKEITKRSQVCYERVGCFNNGSPFFSLSRPLSVNPESPDEIRTKFMLFNRPNTKVGKVLDARYPQLYTKEWPDFNGSKPLKFVIHGFIDNVYIQNWQNSTKDAFLMVEDADVVLVDWSKGNFLPYTQATANTRLVGAQIADLIKVLQKGTGLKATDVHLVGHSLGAHIAGYVGARTPGLGRITGLDPAGPYFDGTAPQVRLDPNDAEFVDILHTDGESLLNAGLGSRMNLGHVDFWPNLGHDQAGCDKGAVQKLLTEGIADGAMDTVACNHMRSLKLFIETIISTDCPFMAYPCNSENDFLSGKCTSCAGVGCSRMGYHADNVKPLNHQSYYLYTSDESAYCQHLTSVTVRTSNVLTEEDGVLEVKIFGSKGQTDWKALTPVDFDYQGHRTYSFAMGVSPNLGEVRSVSLKWKPNTSVLNPLDWLNINKHTLYVDSVKVRQEEKDSETTLCANSLSLSKNDEETLSKKC